MGTLIILNFRTGSLRGEERRMAGPDRCVLGRSPASVLRHDSANAIVTVKVDHHVVAVVVAVSPLLRNGDAPDGEVAVWGVWPQPNGVRRAAVFYLLIEALDWWRRAGASANNRLG